MTALGMRLVPFLEWLVRMSVQASILILLILLVKLLLRHRLSARFHYWLWVLLLIRLILPSTPQSRLSLFKLVPRELTSRPRSRAISSNRVIQEHRESTETRSIAGMEIAAGQMR
ncbi:MAG: M56 family metallopeptidase, partial [Planctomycetota bacterium]